MWLLALQHHRIWTIGLISTKYSTETSRLWLHNKQSTSERKHHPNPTNCNNVIISQWFFLTRVFLVLLHSLLFNTSCLIIPLLPQPPLFFSRLLFVSILYSVCENGQHRAGAAQPQLLLSSDCSWQPPSIWGRGEWGPEFLCIAPTQTFLSASGCALQSRGLVQFSLHHLLSDGHRLPAALELLHNSQTLLALQTE